MAIDCNMNDLFDDVLGNIDAHSASVLPDGLSYRREILNEAQQACALRRIDATPWRTDLKRRVQHYGWRYDYRARRVGPEDRIGPLPGWLASLADRLHQGDWFTSVPDQAIINEYEPGQGIAAHTDCEPCFGDTVASLSLGGACIMEFCEQRGNGRGSILLEPGSLLVLHGSARYRWTHAIASRRTDVIAGVRRMRVRRVSITFRTVHQRWT